MSCFFVLGFIIGMGFFFIVYWVDFSVVNDMLIKFILVG